jgi:hypothetical protein
MTRVLRWTPAWIGWAVAPLWVLAFFATTRGGGARSLAAAAVFAVLGAGVLALWNRTIAAAGPEGLSVRHRPVPFALPTFRLPLAAVEAVYARQVVRRGGLGDDFVYFAAGAIDAAGRHWELCAPLPSEAEARRTAAELAEIVAASRGRALECHWYGERSLEVDAALRRRAGAWAAVWLAALAAALWLAFSR